MRISDWSSDVCSSDLRRSRARRESRLEQRLTDTLAVNLLGGISKSQADIPVETTLAFDDVDATGYRYDYTNMKYPLLTFGAGIDDPSSFVLAEFRDRPSFLTNKFKTFAADFDRSEEHTSELQSLMRISYAVFCLKKK